jgi:glycosyltransferase involved in cell wall biosynthesis
MGGAEPLILELHKLYPDAPIYTSVYDKEKMTAFSDCDIRTTYLQKLLPKFLRYKHVLWPVLRAHAFRKLDMSAYDLIISSSTAESKSVKKRPDALHICYCNTPIRYYWSHYEEFKNTFNFGPLTFLIRPLIPPFVKWMRRLDLRSVEGVDYFMANSNEIKRRVKKYYGRESTVVFPAVDIVRFQKPQKRVEPRSGFVIWGRHVPYKRFDLAIAACNELGIPLTVIGTGPETKKLKKLAGPTITFTGRVSDEELARLASKAEGFLFAGEEDFGIAPVEALAAGVPVIAYRGGGALDYVIEGKTGVLFNEQSVTSLKAAIESFSPANFSEKELRNFSKKFSPEEFRSGITKFIKNHYKQQL